MAKNVRFNDGEVQWGEWMKPRSVNTSPPINIRTPTLVCRDDGVSSTYPN